MITIDIIKSAITEAVPDIDVDSIPLDKPLKDNGIDSLDFFNIILELQTASGVEEIPDEDIDKLDTINSILGYFQASQ